MRSERAPVTRSRCSCKRRYRSRERMTRLRWAAHDQWRHCALPAAQLAELSSPAAFDRASASVDVHAVLSKVRVSSDISRHLDWLYQDYHLGFERIYLHNVARDHQERFIGACAERVLPFFNQAASGSPADDAAVAAYRNCSRAVPVSSMIVQGIYRSGDAPSTCQSGAILAGRIHSRARDPGGHCVSTTIERQRSTVTVRARKQWRVQPGEPFPLGATTDARRHQLLHLLRGRRPGRAVSLRRGRPRDARGSTGAHRVLLARLSPRRSRPGSDTGSACTAHGTRRRDIGAIRQSSWSIPTRVPSPATSTGIPRSFPIRSAAMTAARRSPTAARTCRNRSSSNDAFDWEGDRPLRRKLHETVVYEVHLKGFTKRHPGIPAAIRGTYAGLAHPAALEYLTTLGVTAVRAAAHSPVRARAAPSSTRACGTTGDTTPTASSRPHGEYSSAGDTGGQVREFKHDGEGAPCRRTGGDPRRRLQPYRRGQPSRSDAVPQGDRQPRLLPHRRIATRGTTWTTPVPATA